MKKILKRNGQANLKTALILAVAIVAFIIAHKAGTAERGYKAIGGEIIVPFLIIFAKDIWEMIKAPFKVVKSEDAN